jgi:acetyl-CoA/propionyl-CoA carboxylase biotin carboxyl carrier protein
VHAFGEANGYPIAIKAAGGGGGRGLRVAASPEEVPEAFAAATREAEAWFGSPGVYLERYLERPKHVEVQVLAPAAGQAMWLGARDCSLQRRHQKLVEETPPPLHAGVVPAMGEAAVAVANACGYVNAGTVEFLVDEDGRFHFLEVNARLQVEHTITEEVLGLDLVACQLRIAAGEALGFGPDDLVPRGHAIECRINAENPARRFLPGPGRIERYREPGGLGVRVDSGYAEGDEVPRAYDSLLAKLVAWGATREEARRRMLRALREFEVEGVPTTIPAHLVLLEHPEFVDGTYTTRTVEAGALDSLVEQGAPGAERATRATAEPSAGDGGAGDDEALEAAPSEPAVLLVAGRPVRLWNPAMAAEASASTAVRTAGGDGVVRSPMHGTILRLEVAKGDRVQPGDLVAVLEAMKMETQVAAPTSGTVTAVLAEAGEVVEAGQPIAELA